MQKITKHNKYIVKKESHYFIHSLIANDDIVVDLDMPLEVAGDLFSAGSVQSNVDLSIEGKAVIGGGYTGATLAAKKGIQIVLTCSSTGSIRSDKAIKLLDKASIEGSLMSNTKISTYGYLIVGGDVSAGEAMTANSFFVVYGSLVAGMKLDAKDSFACDGVVKIAGVPVDTYARVCLNDKVFIKTGDTVNSYSAGSEDEVIVSYDKSRREIMKKKPTDMSPNEVVLVMLDSLFKTISFKIPKIKKGEE